MIESSWFCNLRVKSSRSGSAGQQHLQARAVPPIRICVDKKATTVHAGHTYRLTLGTSGSGEDSPRGLAPVRSAFLSWLVKPRSVRTSPP
jgi:hypothetical protein